MKRSPMKRLTALKRSDKPMKTKKRRRANADAAVEFKVAVCSEPCIGSEIPGHVCEGDLQAMHVVPKRTLRDRGLSHLVYDPANGVAGCYRIHRRHDGAIEKIPRVLLPERALTWAEEHGVMDALERHWPGTPFDEEVEAA